MNKHLKHIILSLCFLVSTAQAIHLFGHILNQHNHQHKEIIHLLDHHKCPICDVSFNSLLPTNNYPQFTWFTVYKDFITILTYEQSFQYQLPEKINPRGPPHLI